MDSVSVILPTYNERDNIGPLIDAVLRALPKAEVIVVDDDSPDLTWKVVANKAEDDSRVHLIRRITERGLTSAIARGIAESRRQVVAWLDCDFAMPPQRLPDLLAPILAGQADIVIGTRYRPGGQDAGHSLTGRLFSQAINRFASLLLGGGVTDWTSGFIMARREVFHHVPLRGDYGEYCIDLLWRAQRGGFRVAEVPYLCGSRHSGESKTALNALGYLQRGWKYVVVILRLFWTVDSRGNPCGRPF